MKIIKFMNISFHDLDFDSLMNRLNKRPSSSLVLLPSGPGLSSLLSDKNYYKALKGSTFNLFDSGFFCILLKLKGIFVKKNSGFLLIKRLLNFFRLNKIDSIYFIDPNFKESVINKKFIKSYLSLSQYSNYKSPIYDFNDPKDFKLLNLLNQKKPRYIIINLGGGVQEKLGYWLKENLKYSSIIFCTGAAIAFHTKSQAPINYAIDKLYLGWFLRCLHNPTLFMPRYLKSFNLIIIFLLNYFQISAKVI